MDLVGFMTSIWIPVGLGIVCLVYGLYMIITKDPSKLRRKDDNRLLKDEKKYAEVGGYLMLFMALGCLVMVIIIELLKNEVLATIESFVWFIIFGILWKLMNDKYGAY